LRGSIIKKKNKQRLDRLMEKYRGGETVPPCPHFGECGGCRFQDIAYEGQLAFKRELANEILGGAAAVERVEPSRPYRYRSRMDMVTAFGKFGLRQAGGYRTVVDISSCVIMQEGSEAAFRKIRPHVLGIEGYDYIRHSGYLRYVVVREAMYTGQVMVNFVTSRRENRLGPVIETIRDEVHSISLICSEGLADLSFGEIFDTIKNGYIEESLDGIRYRITPNSFFQSNAEAALRIYRAIRKRASGRVLDLCAGVGCISLFVAGTADHVTGVERSSEAVETANINKELNRIVNVDFVCSDAGEFLRGARRDYNTIILDPPRSGMQKGAMEQIDRMGADTVIYMSCNPLSFRDDIQALRGYAIESIEAFDMFGQTPHVELLCVFTRKHY
jgi:tRNA (uracil-5-)-methyltransferase